MVAGTSTVRESSMLGEEERERRMYTPGSVEPRPPACDCDCDADCMLRNEVCTG